MNKRISLVNYPALAGDVCVLLVCISAYLLIGKYCDPDHILTQIANTVVGIVLVFCVFDVWHHLRAGISVRDGHAELAGDPEGFATEQLTDIRLEMPDGTVIDRPARIYRRVNVIFVLQSGKNKVYEARMLTSGQYHRIRSLLCKKEEK